jgi:hypothetical protein
MVGGFAWVRMRGVGGMVSSSTSWRRPQQRGFEVSFNLMTANWRCW